MKGSRYNYERIVSLYKADFIFISLGNVQIWQREVSQVGEGHKKEWFED